MYININTQSLRDEPKTRIALSCPEEKIKLHVRIKKELLLWLHFKWKCEKVSGPHHRVEVKPFHWTHHECDEHRVNSCTVKGFKVVFFMSIEADKFRWISYILCTLYFSQRVKKYNPLFNFLFRNNQLISFKSLDSFFIPSVNVFSPHHGNRDWLINIVVEVNMRVPWSYVNLFLLFSSSCQVLDLELKFISFPKWNLK